MITAKRRFKVGHNALLPEENMTDRVAEVRIWIGCVGRAHYLAPLVDAVGGTKWAAERAEVGHHTVLPEEGMIEREAGVWVYLIGF